MALADYKPGSTALAPPNREATLRESITHLERLAEVTQERDDLSHDLEKVQTELDAAVIRLALLEAPVGDEDVKRVLSEIDELDGDGEGSP